LPSTKNTQAIIRGKIYNLKILYWEYRLILVQFILLQSLFLLCFLWSVTKHSPCCIETWDTIIYVY
jgi:hypothetical protein